MAFTMFWSPSQNWMDPESSLYLSLEGKEDISFNANAQLPHTFFNLLFLLSSDLFCLWWDKNRTWQMIVVASKMADELCIFTLQWWGMAFKC